MRATWEVSSRYWTRWIVIRSRRDDPLPFRCSARRCATIPETSMDLALFDLDNTLLAGDSDYEWAQFLVEQRVVDPEVYKAGNDRFYRQYMDGTLDIHEFLDFQLAPLSRHSSEQLQLWRERFMAEKIAPIMLPRARELIERHRSAGDLCAIITATNSFITTPIAAAFGI